MSRVTYYHGHVSDFWQHLLDRLRHNGILRHRVAIDPERNRVREFLLQIKIFRFNLFQYIEKVIVNKWKEKLFTSNVKIAGWAFTISSAGTFRKNSTTSSGSSDFLPRVAANLNPRSGWLWFLHQALQSTPLCPIALWNNPEGSQFFLFIFD